MAKLLVIDDEQSILETLRMFFEEKGLKVLTADTGAKGMGLFNKEHPQVVILDIRLPDINGLDILQTMINTGQSVKIIMITRTLSQLGWNKSRACQYTGTEHRARINTPEKTVPIMVLLSRIRRIRV